MATGQLILHRGARPVERAELELVETPPATQTWHPLGHNHVLSTVEDTLSNAGFRIAKAEYGLSQDNARFFSTLTLESQICDGVSLAVGIRNSHDKTFPIGLCAGSRVFNCDNLSFASEIYVSKKHTRFGQERFIEGISNAVQTLGQYQAVESQRIAVYRDHSLGEEQAAAVLLHSYEEGVLSARTLPEAIKEWRQPTLEEFAPRTAWSLFNAITAALKDRQGMPAVFASLTMKAYGLLDRQVNFTQVV